MAAVEEKIQSPAKLSLSELVSALTQSLKKGKNIPEVQQIMSSYDADAGDWKRFMFWDPHKYTRNLIATDNETFTLMLLCWPTSICSPIHDHAGSECWMRVIQGSVCEIRYCCSTGTMECIGRKETGPGSVIFINDNIGLHKIENPSSTVPAVTLHCYSPPFDSCKAFCEESSVGIERPVTYFSEFGELVEYN